METVIFSAFLFFTLALLGYAFYNKKVIYLASVSSLLMIILGTSIVAGGITQTYAGAYGFLNGTAAVTGIATTTVTFNDVYTTAGGTFLGLLGILTFMLSLYYMLKGSEEEEED
jgi:hypothetical protein